MINLYQILKHYPHIPVGGTTQKGISPVLYSYDPKRFQEKTSNLKQMASKKRKIN